MCTIHTNVDGKAHAIYCVTIYENGTIQGDFSLGYNFRNQERQRQRKRKSVTRRQNMEKYGRIAFPSIDRLYLSFSFHVRNVSKRPTNRNCTATCIQIHFILFVFLFLHFSIEHIKRFIPSYILQCINIKHL